MHLHDSRQLGEITIAEQYAFRSALEGVPALRVELVGPRIVSSKDAAEIEEDKHGARLYDSRWGIDGEGALSVDGFPGNAPHKRRPAFSALPRPPGT